jgi:rhomboid protease GluP
MIGNKQPITTTLIGMNVAVYVVMVLTGVPPVEPLIPQLMKWGANYGPLSLGPEPWRILASTYVHAGIIHIALNMWCLWSLGFLAERIFDPWTYVLTYTFSGLAGSLASLWWHPGAVGVGASGAIFGLAGALIAALYLGHLPISRQTIQGTLRSLLIFAGYNLFFGAAVPGIDNSAHIGGLVAGLALGAVLAKHLTAPAEVRDRWRVGVFFVAAIVLLLVYMELKHVSVGPPPS